MKRFFMIIAALSFFMPLFAKKTKSALDYYKEGIQFENRSEYFEASQAFQQAVNLNPSFSDAYFHLAKVNYETNDFSLALNYIENALNLSKENIEMEILKGYILISTGNLSQSQDIFERILKKQPNNVEARFGLAQLQIFDGKLNGAKDYYNDALKRDASNKKALLSLALLTSETENWDSAESYIKQAISFHSGEAEVHYLASYIEAKRENFDEAERRARAAVHINPNFTKAYSLLATILYHKGNYSEVIDISDFLISRNRNEISAWYLKGLAQKNSGNEKAAIATWSTALSIDHTDEILRAALELLISRNLPLEDKNRIELSKYHSDKGNEFSKRYNSVEGRYEYQRALRLNPDNTDARKAFAKMLSIDGLNEQYLEQLKFIKSHTKTDEKADKLLSKDAKEKKNYENTQISDTIEGYDSLLKSSLAKKWNTEPFYLDKTRWNLAFYSVAPLIQLQHPELETIAAKMLSEIFSGVATTNISVSSNIVSGFSEAFTLSKKQNKDYFVLLTAEETEREILLKAQVYNGRTGIKIADLTSFRTGNNRFSSALRSIRRDILDLLPVRGKILNRIGSDVLLDIGKTEGVVEKTVLNVIHKGGIKTKDKEAGIIFEEKDILGKITVTEVSEEISQGILSDTGFYDKVNNDDEVVIIAVPDENGNVKIPEISEDTTPAADNNGKKRFGKKEKAANANVQFRGKTPALLELLKVIN